MLVCTIGFFDGVHRGHQFLIRQVRAEAVRRGGRSLVITFDRHPRTVFAPMSVPALLTTAEEKMRMLRESGVDEIYVLPFDKEMAALTAREFMAEVLKGRLGVDVLVIGYDHRFGRPQTHRETYEDYAAYGRELGIEVVLAKELEGEHVSSSAVRKALEAGDVEQAARLLGRPYSWTGRVVHGHGVGRQLGFPTANFEALVPEKMLPARGAYAVKALKNAHFIEGDALCMAMLNIGSRPTINNGSDVSVEAHLLDYEGDLYGTTLTLSFIARLREERKFDSEEALREQLERDEERARRCLTPQPLRKDPPPTPPVREGSGWRSGGEGGVISEK